jgi:hypothetical protein
MGYPSREEGFVLRLDSSGLFALSLPRPAIGADPVLARVRRYLKSQNRRDRSPYCRDLLFDFRSGKSRRMRLPLHFDGLRRGANGKSEILLALLSWTQ